MGKMLVEKMPQQNDLIGRSSLGSAGEICQADR